jgi:hypothetical protein
MVIFYKKGNIILIANHYYPIQIYNYYVLQTNDMPKQSFKNIYIYIFIV